MMKNLVVTVGNGMMGDDGAGPLLAQMMKRSPLENWELINGGSMPENCLHQIREMKPDRVLIVDAADMDLAPGEIRLIEKGEIGSAFLMTTHNLPLTYLVESLQEFVPEVRLAGIQPDVVAFGYPLSPSVKQAVEQVYTRLKKGEFERKGFMTTQNASCD